VSAGLGCQPLAFCRAGCLAGLWSWQPPATGHGQGSSDTTASIFEFFYLFFFLPPGFLAPTSMFTFVVLVITIVICLCHVCFGHFKYLSAHNYKVRQSAGWEMGPFPLGAQLSSKAVGALGGAQAAPWQSCSALFHGGARFLRPFLLPVCYSCGGTEDVIPAVSISPFLHRLTTQRWTP